MIFGISLRYRYLTKLPHTYLLQYIPFLELGSKLTEPAWAIVNDSMHIPDLLDVPPDAVAAGAIFLASKKGKLCRTLFCFFSWIYLRKVTYLSHLV